MNNLLVTVFAAVADQQLFPGWGEQVEVPGAGAAGAALGAPQRALMLV